MFHLHLRLLVVDRDGQVIGPFLIILRVANQKAFTTDAIPGTTGSIRFESRGRSTIGNETRSDSVTMDPDSPAGALGVGVEPTVGEIPDRSW